MSKASSLLISVFAFAIVVLCQPEDWRKKVAEYDWLYSFAQEPHQFNPAIGNGYMATVVLSDDIYVAGLFNGKMTDYDHPSHRARIPSTVNIAVTTIDDAKPKKVDCALDLESARYIERYDGSVEQTRYVHRKRPNLLVYELRAVSGSHKVCVKSSPGGPTEDIGFQTADQGPNYRIYRGLTKLTEWLNDEKRRVVVATWEPTQARPTAEGEISPWEHCFHVSVDSDPVFLFTVISVTADVEEVKKMYMETVKVDGKALLEEHLAEWQELRQAGSSIHTSGYPELAQATNASIYDILVSMRDDLPWSNSPGGLATNYYNGHVFWDFETWMFPALLVMYPGLAKNGLQYRLDHINGARKKAKDNDYVGAMWPWESAYTGDETTPTFANTGKMEHHISGDIIFAARQFDYLHRDKVLREKIWCPLALETGEYWASRVEKDAKGNYHILHVIPPDEYIENVTDSIYTNVVARISLRYASECKHNDTWLEIADHLYIDYDEAKDWHPEYVGYKIGQIVKQADTTLVSFPLGQHFNTSTLINDLLYYEQVTDRDGPAMTWSMFLTDYLELARDQEDINSATYKYFYKSFLMNVKGPFFVWWESPEWGALHFATGAGGFLQALLFGYGGLRIHYDPENPNILARLKPVVPISPVDRLELRGLNLLGGQVRLDVLLENGETYVRTLQSGIYLSSKVIGKFDLIPGSWIHVPSNIGLEDKEGFYVISGSQFLKVGGIIGMLIITILLI